MRQEWALSPEFSASMDMGTASGLNRAGEQWAIGKGDRSSSQQSMHSDTSPGKASCHPVSSTPSAATAPYLPVASLSSFPNLVETCVFSPFMPSPPSSPPLNVSSLSKKQTQAHSSPSFSQETSIRRLRERPQPLHSHSNSHPDRELDRELYTILAAASASGSNSASFLDPPFHSSLPNANMCASTSSDIGLSASPGQEAETFHKSSSDVGSIPDRGFSLSHSQSLYSHPRIQTVSSKTPNSSCASAPIISTGVHASSSVPPTFDTPYRSFYPLPYRPSSVSSTPSLDLPYSPPLASRYVPHGTITTVNAALPVFSRPAELGRASLQKPLRSDKLQNASQSEAPCSPIITKQAQQVPEEGTFWPLKGERYRKRTNEEVNAHSPLSHSIPPKVDLSSSSRPTEREKGSEREENTEPLGREMSKEERQAEASESSDAVAAPERKKLKYPRKAELARLSRQRKKEHIRQIEDRCHELETELDKLKQKLETKKRSVGREYRMRREHQKQIKERLLALIAKATTAPPLDKTSIPSTAVHRDSNMSNIVFGKRGISSSASLVASSIPPLVDDLPDAIGSEHAPNLTEDEQNELHSLVSRFVFNSRERQSHVDHHFDSVHQCLQPGLQVKFAMWGLDQPDQFYEPGAGLWTSLLEKEIGLNSEQISWILSKRTSMHQERKNLVVCEAMLSETRSAMHTHLHSLHGHMDDLASVMTPLQLAKYCLFVENHQWLINVL